MAGQKGWYKCISGTKLLAIAGQPSWGLLGKWGGKNLPAEASLYSHFPKLVRCLSHCQKCPLRVKNRPKRTAFYSSKLDFTQFLLGNLYKEMASETSACQTRSLLSFFHPVLKRNFLYYWEMFKSRGGQSQKFSARSRHGISLRTGRQNVNISFTCIIVDKTQNSS